MSASGAYAESTGAPIESDVALRGQLSSLQALLVLAMRMTESGDERQILQLTAKSADSLGHCRLHGVCLLDGQWQTLEADVPADVQRAVDTQLAVLNEAGGALAVPGEQWGWAFPLRALQGNFGYLVMGADADPSAAEQFRLRVLAQQTGIALANARLHARERATAAQLRAANTALAETVAALRRSTAIHDRFTRVAAAGAGQDGVAQALHELTGYAVAVEDRHGNLRAWAGPDRPHPYPKDAPTDRERMLRRAALEGRPIRDGDRLLALARPHDDVLGVLALIDPAGTSGEDAQLALEHGVTVLAMELARLHSLAEAELRLRRDLVEELLAGTDEASALARAQALGYDLERSHRVVVVEGHGRRRMPAVDDDLHDRDADHGGRADDELFHAVRRAARHVGVGSLLVARAGAVVVLSDTDRPWESFRAAIQHELGGGRCRLGVGDSCDRLADLPDSYRQAQTALSLQGPGASADRAVAFDELGIYRLFAEIEDPARLERFVQQWLGPLLDYDDRKNTELVATLTRYLECGGSYETTAKALLVHRSTLKYRLQRIRAITGLDVSEPDVRFNLQLATRAWHTLLALRTRT